MAVTNPLFGFVCNVNRSTVLWPKTGEVRRGLISPQVCLYIDLNLPPVGRQCAGVLSDGLFGLGTDLWNSQAEDILSPDCSEKKKTSTP